MKLLYYIIQKGITYIVAHTQHHSHHFIDMHACTRMGINIIPPPFVEADDDQAELRRLATNVDRLSS